MIMVHGMYCMRCIKHDCDNRKKVRWSVGFKKPRTILLGLQIKIQYVTAVIIKYLTIKSIKLTEK